MILTLYSVAVGLALMLAMLLALEFGRRLGVRDLARNVSRAGVGPAEGAIFGLMGLLLAFTFSGAATRFDVRRMQIVEESNAIQVAWLRLDVLPPEAQPRLRDSFRKYVDARIAAYHRIPNLDTMRVRLERAERLKERIWDQADIACTNSPRALFMILPAVNEMFAVAARRDAMPLFHPPFIVFVMLAVLALAGALLAGYGMSDAQKRSWLHMVVFTGVLAFTIAIIVDLEFPRHGLIRIDDFDRILMGLRRTMG
jgi:hypothetical protein